MRTPLVAIVVGVLWTSGAWSQTLDPDKAQAWLEKTFGIKTDRVVEATPDDLVTLRTIEPRPPSDFHVIVHLENFRPPDPLTPPSSEEEFFINCPSRRFHVERIESFSEHGSRGAQSTSQGPSLWGRAIPNSPEERIVAGVCGPPSGLSEAKQPGPAITTPEPAPIPTPHPLAQPPPPRPVRAATPAPKSASRPDSARVQFFAGDREEAERVARTLPGRLAAAGLLGEPEVVEASVGGRRVYRVQIAGFASRAAAARFCAAAKAAGLDCFVPPDRR